MKHDAVLPFQLEYVTLCKISCHKQHISSTKNRKEKDQNLKCSLFRFKILLGLKKKSIVLPIIRFHSIIRFILYPSIIPSWYCRFYRALYDFPNHLTVVFRFRIITL